MFKILVTLAIIFLSLLMLLGIIIAIMIFIATFNGTKDYIKKSNKERKE